MPNLPAIENSTKPTSWHQLDYIGLLPPWKGQHFGHGFGFPECSASAKTIIPWFTGCLIYTIVFHIAFLLIKEFPSQQIKCNSWPMVMVIHWSYLCSLCCFLVSHLCTLLVQVLSLSSMAEEYISDRDPEHR